MAPDATVATATWAGKAIKAIKVSVGQASSVARVDAASRPRRVGRDRG
jgi:hypothetical protein